LSAAPAPALGLVGCAPRPRAPQAPRAPWDARWAPQPAHRLKSPPRSLHPTTSPPSPAPAPPQVGSNGVLSIESSSSTETFVEVTEGMEIDRGYISPQFVTNNERLLVEYDNCKVLVTDQKIESVRDIIPILEQVRRRPAADSEPPPRGPLSAAGAAAGQGGSLPAPAGGPWRRPAQLPPQPRPGSGATAAAGRLSKGAACVSARSRLDSHRPGSPRPIRARAHAQPVRAPPPAR
jgi:hypothetical protein